MTGLAARFSAAMAALGPWGGRAVAVAVSGGADSMALTLLAQDWCRAQGRKLEAFTVDHGLRPEAAAEAAWVAARLRKRGLDCRILTLDRLRPGSGLAARARAARYQALFDACREAKVIDLLLGHHARDQAETLLLRQAGASGPAGLAGMAGVSLRGGVRLARPLLAVAPEELRDYLRAQGVDWIEDPSNRNQEATRNRLRLSLQEDATVRALLAATGRAAARRRADETAAAGWIARHCALFPGGYGWIGAAEAPEQALTALIQAISGKAYPPRGAAAARLAAALRPATLHGARLIAGRGGFFLAREAAAMQPPVPAGAGAWWDGRFRVLRVVEPGLTVGALGADTPRWRDHSQLPFAVLQTVPVLRRDGMVLGSPLLAAGLPCNAALLFQPPRPAAPAAFRP